VVRLTKVISSDMALLTGWVQALRAGEAIRPFSDMTMAPVPLRFAVQALAGVAERRLPGITQVSAEQDITYEEAARHLAQRLGADPALVEPVRAEECSPHPEALPRHTTLDTSRLRAELGLTPPDAYAALDTVLR